MTHHQDVLKQVVEALNMTYIYADLNDANLGVDKVPDIKYPVFIFIAPSKKLSTVDAAEMIRRKVVINCMILLKTVSSSTDFKYEDVQPTIRQAEVMLDRVIHSLNRNSVTDLDGDGIVNFEVTDTYSEFDVSLYGVYSSFEWPVNELTRGC